MNTQTTQRERELEIKLKLLANFGSMVSKETKLDPLLEIIALQVKTILGCDRCSVFIYDAKARSLWAKVAMGLQHTEIRIPFGSGIVGHVAASGMSVNIPNAYSDPRFSSELDKLTGYMTKNILATPLKNINGKIIGVFEAINKYSRHFTEEDEGILKLISSLAASAIENAKLYQRLSESQMETIYRLATTAEYRDQQDTAIHLRHISTYSSLIAASMGLSEEDVENVSYASPLHDIGKVGIADAILLKPGRLTPEEFEEMKKHTLYGAKILANAESQLLQSACRIAASHHEKYNGKGYPNGLRGEEIPLFARIVSVADVFDALCMKRVYKPRWEPEDARKYIVEQSGKDFDPAVVAAFDRIFPEILKAQQSTQDGRKSIIPGISGKMKKMF
ncbi:MAG: HD domain-containing protein [Elusimicrobiales bacterium]|nr:HD domain-containing protein [Elusimicrobiales bacterium]